MLFCVEFNATIRKGTKNTHNSINYLCLVVVIHKDVRRLDVAMDNFRITWQQIKKGVFHRLQGEASEIQYKRTEGNQELTSSGALALCDGGRANLLQVVGVC
jgi:hypothetical protein